MKVKKQEKHRTNMLKRSWIKRGKSALKRSWIKRKPKKIKNIKLPKISTWRDERKKTWDKFSIFIRLRDCLKTTGTPDKGRCYTCGRIYDFKFLQAGHLVPGRGNAVLFDEQGVKAQCYRCNCIKGGEQLLFRRNLVKEYGEQLVELLENKRYQTQKYTITDLQLLRQFYIDKTEQLRKQGSNL